MKTRPVHALELTEVPRDQFDDGLRKYFNVAEEKLGFLPNVLRAYAWNPERLRWFSRFYNEIMLGESGLSKLEREMIAVVVSSANRCWYCQVAHGAAVRQIGKDPVLGEQMVMNWRTAELSPRQRAMLVFAEKLTLESARIAEADRQALRDVGLSEAEIWDICDVAGLFAMTNRVASGVGMQPNPEYHAANRG